MRTGFFVSLIFSMSAVTYTAAHAQGSTGNLGVRSFMSAEQFQAAGLSKLTPDELAALDRWFLETASKIMQAASTSPQVTTGRALDFSQLEGAVIIAEDGEFLGVINTNAADRRSIANEVGQYGSTVSRVSIFNEVGRYGGEVPECLHLMK